jgi:hypothetical protein
VGTGGLTSLSVRLVSHFIFICVTLVLDFFAFVMFYFPFVTRSEVLLNLFVACGLGMFIWKYMTEFSGKKLRN